MDILSYFFGLFKVNLKTDNYRSKTEYLITVRFTQSAAMPVLFLLDGPKIGFSPAGVTRCPDKHEIRHGGVDPNPPPMLNFTYIGAEMWEYSPKTVKISNFDNKFVPWGRLVCTIFTKFSAFVCVYR